MEATDELAWGQLNVLARRDKKDVASSATLGGETNLGLPLYFVLGEGSLHETERVWGAAVKGFPRWREEAAEEERT